MRHFLVTLIGSVLLGTGPAFSQFIITSSVPSDGSVNIPLSTIVSFTFSAPLDTSMQYGEQQFPISIQANDPRDSMVIGTISYSTDLLTISFQVTQTANTDFVWIVIGAQSSGGQHLSQSYALNYTTSTTHGTRTVSGTVTFEEGDPANALVGLLDRPLFSEEENIVLIGTIVPNSSGEYVANYVRDGMYWIVGAKDADGDGEINPEGSDVIGFYDPNQDDQPDSIVISGGSLTGINMALRRLFVPVTARIYVDTATVIAQQYAPDQELRAIIAHSDQFEIGLDGTAVFWLYQFYSPSLQFPTRVLMSSFFISTDTSGIGEPNLPPDMTSIPSNFVDSNVPMDVAESNGGSEFRAQYNVVRYYLSGGNFYWFFPQDSSKIFWLVEYEAIEPDSSRLIFSAFVDIVTGEFLGGGITGVEEPLTSIPGAYSLSQNYPNPFNPTTTISFSLPSKSFVSLKIFDALGKEVATLVSEELAPGTYQRQWKANGLPSSVYFYRLIAGSFIETKKLILLK